MLGEWLGEEVWRGRRLRRMSNGRGWPSVDVIRRWRLVINDQILQQVLSCRTASGGTVEVLRRSVL